jgi:hypothetical protein
MRIKLYLDEDAMDRDLAEALRRRGVDVLTALEAEMIARPDKEHLEFAALQERVLYSFNVGDFAALHQEFLSGGKHHAGIVLAQQQRFNLGEQMRRLLRLVAARTDKEMKDKLEFLGAW